MVRFHLPRHHYRERGGVMAAILDTGFLLADVDALPAHDATCEGGTAWGEPTSRRAKNLVVRALR